MKIYNDSLYVSVIKKLTYLVGRMSAKSFISPDKSDGLIGKEKYLKICVEISEKDEVY